MAPFVPEVVAKVERGPELGGASFGPPTRWQRVLKRLLDLALLALTGAVVLPLMLPLALLVWLESPGPIFHRRRVLGLHGRPFGAFKLRTMAVNADDLLAKMLAADPFLKAEFWQHHKLKDDPRVTRTGKWLRRRSLDELPQWLNVLRNEMSFVGPRMMAPDEAERYGPLATRVLSVKPGLTGPWQVMGRNTLAYAERVRLSSEYVENYSLWRDLEILLRTIPVVLCGRGAH